MSVDTWGRIMNGLRIGLPLGATLILIHWQRARLLGRSPPDYTKHFAMAAATVLAFGAYFDFMKPGVWYPEFYHRDEFFHHYLGAKYSQELGYTRIYECAGIAEIELGRGAEARKRVYRDLRDGRLKRFAESEVFRDPARCKKHFSPAAWTAFKQDIDWFWAAARGEYWESAQKDHGFNAAPVWILLAKPFASLGAAGDAFFKVLASIDVQLNIAAIAMLYWAFGGRVAAIAAIFWGCNAPSSFTWTGGAFLRQEWLFLLVASLCLARKRRMFLAGAALTWASLSRVAPALFFIGWGIVIAFSVLARVRERRNGKAVELLDPQHRRLIAGAIVAFSILVPASIVVTGPNSYPEFLTRMRVYQVTPVTNDMGLETILAHDWKGRMSFTRDDSLDDPFERWKTGYLNRVHQLRFVHYGIVGLLFVWTAWALRRTKLLWIGQALSLPLVVALTNLPSYYYSFFIVSAALAKVRPELGVVLLVTTGASNVLLLSFYWVDDKYAAQAWLFGICSVLLLAGMSRWPRRPTHAT